MACATWNGEIIADSKKCEKVEGNMYFPMEDVKSQYLKQSSTHTVCGWKGTASYFTLEVKGMTNVDAAWFYPEPKDAAKNIKNYIAFWKGVKVEE